MIQPSETGTPSQYEIVRPTPEDMPRLLELWKGQYDYHHNLDPDYFAPYDQETAERELQKAIEGDEPHIFVAREGMTLVGFITFGSERNDYPDANIRQFGELKELFVTQDARGQGIAKALIANAENHFRAEGLDHIGVHASPFNKPALALYEKQGYVPRQQILYKPLRK